MTLLITCGVAQEWCEFAQMRLRSMGVNAPEVSKRSDLTIEDLLSGASMSANVSSLEAAMQGDEITLGRTWEIATADFFISNARSDNWGWADPRNVLFLNSWREFEPNAKFLLLYGSAAQFLATEIESMTISDPDIQKRVDFWIAYQRKMLDFYHRNRDVSTLLHLDFLGGSAERAADTVSEKLGVQLNRLNDHAMIELSKVTNITATHLVSHVEGHLDVYEELEGSADTVLDPPPINDSEYAESVLNELRSLAKAENALSEANQRNAELEHQLANAVRELDESRINEQTLSQALNRDHEEPSQGELAAEMDALQSQLAQTQNELERYFSKYQELKNASPVGENLEHTSPVATSSSVTLDFRSFVDATGLYYPEAQGRWAGPVQRSDIQLKDLTPGHYRLSLRVVDAMSTEILYGVKLLFNGRELPTSTKIFSNVGGRLAPLRRLKARAQGHPKPFPVEIKSELKPADFDLQQLSQVFSIVCPGVASPTNFGGEDNRKLSICVQSLILSETE